MAAVTAGSGAGSAPAGSPEATGGSTGSGGWRRPHGPLQRYYGPSTAEAAEAPPDPTDINGPHFDPEAFMTKVTKETPPAGTPTLARDPGLRWAPGGPRGASSRGISVGSRWEEGGPQGPQNLRTPRVLRGSHKGPLREPYGCASLWTLIPYGKGIEVLWSSWIGGS